MGEGDRLQVLDVVLAFDLDDRAEEHLVRIGSCYLLWLRVHQPMAGRSGPRDDGRAELVALFLQDRLAWIGLAALEREVRAAFRLCRRLVGDDPFALLVVVVDSGRGRIREGRLRLVEPDVRGAECVGQLQEPVRGDVRGYG